MVYYLALPIRKLKKKRIITMRNIYLDHNATTPVLPEVAEAMLIVMVDSFGNASSIHNFGREAKGLIEEARQAVASFVNASPAEIYFTSGGTEADNLAVKGIAYANRHKGKHIIISAIEHHAVLYSASYLADNGYEITCLPVDRQGLVDPDDLQKALREDTILVSIIHANNEIGTIQPVAELAQIARAKGVYFHTDAVQSTGKIPVDVKTLGVDLLSISAHKIYGPKGVGALFIRSGTNIVPFVHGGAQERNRRAGTENVAGAVGFAKALEIARRDWDIERPRLQLLSDYFSKAVQERVEAVQLNGHPTQRVPTTLNFSFQGIEGEAIIINLDLEGIAVASGSACASGATEPSHVLTAIGLSSDLAKSSVRFSIGRLNTSDDIDYVLEVLPRVVKRLRAMSPLYAGA